MASLLKPTPLLLLLLLLLLLKAHLPPGPPLGLPPPGQFCSRQRSEVSHIDAEMGGLARTTIEVSRIGLSVRSARLRSKQRT